MNAQEMQNKIDDLYEQIKSHTRSCECTDCYEYDRAVRERTKYLTRDPA